MRMLQGKRMDSMCNEPICSYIVTRAVLRKFGGVVCTWCDIFYNRIFQMYTRINRTNTKHFQYTLSKCMGMSESKPNRVHQL